MTTAQIINRWHGRPQMKSEGGYDEVWIAAIGLRMNCAHMRTKDAP
jgi:hypothetical protein